jgi:hypothetical protein
VAITLVIFFMRPDQSQNTSDPKHTDHRWVTSTYHSNKELLQPLRSLVPVAYSSTI